MATAAEKKAAAEKAVAEQEAAEGSAPETHTLYCASYPHLAVYLDGVEAAKFSDNVFETEDEELAAKIEGVEGIVRVAK